MATLFAQNSITLCNPFSLLESDVNLDDSTNVDTAIDADLDISTWSVVNSPSASDDEGDNVIEGNDDDEIYHWESSSSDNSDSSTGNPILEPLRLSSVRDGFTNISKVMTAHSHNSLSASCPEHRGTWVLKVNKRRSKEPQHGHQETATISTETHDKRRLSSMSDTESSSSKAKAARVENNGANDHDDNGMIYMGLTEHELSKSSRATKIKNKRIATSHVHTLAKELGCFSKETNKVDKKLFRALTAKSTCNSKNSGKKALKGDF
ncbi:hypothetical protein FBU30_006270 [Linnemannia zychae]|nr:hypothetical protein FBU30_006270 [Linnemannia zychae]